MGWAAGQYQAEQTGRDGGGGSGGEAQQRAELLIEGLRSRSFLVLSPVDIDAGSIYYMVWVTVGRDVGEGGDAGTRLPLWHVVCQNAWSSQPPHTALVHSLRPLCC